MKWVPDRTGRFAQRPHYEPTELDTECEAIIRSFLKSRNGRVNFPIVTDDLIVLLERETADVDIYADLSGEGSDVEGVTYFLDAGKPHVKISRHLAEGAYAIHRFRTTATHELGHVKFHSFLWAAGAQSLLFAFDEPIPKGMPRCHRESIQPLSKTDWMEWQAGYACGAFLMPITYLSRLVDDTRKRMGWMQKPSIGSEEAADLISRVSHQFDVSLDAARVRLTQLWLLTAQQEQSGNLFG